MLSFVLSAVFIIFLCFKTVYHDIIHRCIKFCDFFFLLLRPVYKISSKQKTIMTALCFKKQSIHEMGKIYIIRNGTCALSPTSLIGGTFVRL